MIISRAKSPASIRPSSKWLGTFAVLLLISLLAFQTVQAAGELLEEPNPLQQDEDLVIWQPVTGVGDGITTPVGSLAHKRLDAYAIDYQWEEEGVDIYPAMPGRVVFSQCVDDYGCTVVLRHREPDRWNYIYYSIYAHLMADSLPEEDLVVDGSAPIGRMGKTGRGSNGIVHLHFAMRYSQNSYDGETALYGGKGMYALDTSPFMR